MFCKPDIIITQVKRESTFRHFLGAYRKQYRLTISLSNTDGSIYIYTQVNMVSVFVSVTQSS